MESASDASALDIAAIEEGNQRVGGDEGNLPPPPALDAVVIATAASSSRKTPAKSTPGRRPQGALASKALGTKMGPPPAPTSASKQAKTPGSVRQSHVPAKSASRALASRQRLVGTPGTRGAAGTRSGFKAGGAQVPALHTPARKAGGGRGDGATFAPAQTPRQAAIAARKHLTEKKQREGAILKQQQQELKNAAKAREAERMAEKQRALKARAEKAQRQRLAKAAANKAAREKQTETQAMELQAKMQERKELKDTLLREEKERRRSSLAHRSAAWSREREMKKRQREARQQEQQIIMEGRNVFREAKNTVKEQEELTAKQERLWRSRRDFIHKTLTQGQGDIAAYEAYQLRRDRALDQAALDKAAQDEKRLRRTSAQWRRNKKMLDAEIERGMGKGADPFRVADDLYWREQSRKEDQEFKEAQKALRRESRQRRRRSDMRRNAVEEAMRERERERDADLKDSEEAGMKDAAAYREACLRRERESLDGRRRKFQDEKALDQWGKELDQRMDAEERLVSQLARGDVQAYERELEEVRKAEEELKRQEQVQDRLYKQDEELRRKEQEAEERRILLEDRESVSASKKREKEAEMDRLEELRELPSEKTKLEILEAIWARQSHPAAAAAARNRRRLELRTVKEEDCSAVSDSGSASDSDSSNGNSSSSSGLGIAGRVSDTSSFDSVLAEWRERNTDSGAGAGAGASVELAGGDATSSSSQLLGRSSIGLGGNVRLAEEGDDEREQEWAPGVSPDGNEEASAELFAPAWEDVSVIEKQDAVPTMLTVEAAAVLAAAEQSFDSDGISGEEAILAAVAAGSAGDSFRPESSYPVRMLNFSDHEENSNDILGVEKTDDVWAQGGSDEERAAAMPPSPSSSVAAEGCGQRGDDTGSGVFVSGDSNESGVLMVSNTEELDRAEGEECEGDDAGEAVSRTVVSIEEGDEGAARCGGRESSVLGVMERSDLGGSIEDGALASLDGNEGCKSLVLSGVGGDERDKEEGEGGEEGALAEGGVTPMKAEVGVALAAATPITPDDC